MKKFFRSAKKILYRTIPLVVALIIFCYLPLSAKKVSAASYSGVDYQDYISDVYYQADSKIIECLISWQYNYVQLNSYSGSNIKGESGTYNFYYDLNALPKVPANDSPTSRPYDRFSVVVLPFGVTRMLKLNNIPYGTEFDFIYNINSYHLSNFELSSLNNATATIEFQWWNAKFSQIGTSVAYPETKLDEDWDLKVTLPLDINKPDGAAYVRFRVVLHFAIFEDSGYNTFHIYPSSLRMRFHESGLQILEDQNQKIIDKLGNLSTQNNTIINQNNNMINGTPQQNQQVQNDVNQMENSADKLGDLTDDMSVTKPDLSGVDVSADSIVNVADQTLLTAPLTKLWKDPTILGIVTTVFTLILVSWVFFGKKE